MSQTDVREREMMQPKECPDPSDTSAYEQHVRDMALAWEYDCKIEASMQQVLPHLFLGSVQSAWNEDLLVENNVKHVLTIMSEELYHPFSTHIQFAERPANRGYRPKTDKSAHIEYAYLQLNDCEDDFIDDEMFEYWSKFIHDRIERQETVLVHCQAGISRSVTFVIAYLIRYHAQTRDKALQTIRQVRCIAYPNDGYYGKLWEYEKYVKQQRPTAHST